MEPRGRRAWLAVVAARRHATMRTDTTTTRETTGRHHNGSTSTSVSYRHEWVPHGAASSSAALWLAPQLPAPKPAPKVVALEIAVQTELIATDMNQLQPDTNNADEAPNSSSDPAQHSFGPEGAHAMVTSEHSPLSPPPLSRRRSVIFVEATSPRASMTGSFAMNDGGADGVATMRPSVVQPPLFVDEDDDAFGTYGYVDDDGNELFINDFDDAAPTTTAPSQSPLPNYVYHLLLKDKMLLTNSEDLLTTTLPSNGVIFGAAAHTSAGEAETNTSGHAGSLRKHHPSTSSSYYRDLWMLREYQRMNSKGDLMSDAIEVNDATNFGVVPVTPFVEVDI